MSEHTPGPWGVGSKIKEYDPEYENDLLGQNIDFANHTGAIQIWGESRKELNANACLIAAAPDLLEALEVCIPAPSQYADSGLAKSNMRYEEALRIREQAIAKARGESDE